MEFGWIEAVHKNKLIVVPQKGKNQFLPSNRIAFSWRGEKLSYNANQAHELLEQHLKTAFNFMHRQRHSLILRNWILIFHVDIFLYIVNYGKLDL